jgi:hypothetical protein
MKNGVNLKLMRVLPPELIAFIFSYTYTPQPALLLLNLRNYCQTKQIIANIYYSTYMSMIVPEKIVVDIFFFINRYMPLSDGFSHDMYEIWFRDLRLQTIPDVDEQVNAIIRHRTSPAIFSLFWAMMLPHERANFITVATHIAITYSHHIDDEVV